MYQYYTTLESQPSDTLEVIKKNYHRLAHRYHPDKPGGDVKKMQEVNVAWEWMQKWHRPATVQEVPVYDRVAYYNNAFYASGRGVNADDFQRMVNRMMADLKTQEKSQRDNYTNLFHGKDWTV